MPSMKLKAGKYMVPVIVEEEHGRLFLNFRYNPSLVPEIKSMQGAKYHGFDEKRPRKIWSVVNCRRNWFRLNYLAHPDKKDPLNPYFKFDQELIPWTPTPRVCYRCQGDGCRFCKLGLITPYNHQQIMTRAGLTYKQALWAAEMGTGKTLAAIYLLEEAQREIIWWVGPKSALASVQLEFMNWRAKVKAKFFTYEGFLKAVENATEVPDIIIFDESSRLKNPAAKRTQAGYMISDKMLNKHGGDAYIIEMSGSPAPKSPCDYYAQCEIICPGFLKEGDYRKFQSRLAIVKKEESITGGMYPTLVTWKDDENKCDVCGDVEDAPQHEVRGVHPFVGDRVLDSVCKQCAQPLGNPGHDTELYHTYKKSINEVAHLYKRMKGLVHVFFKKDCLDLPDKIYKIIRCKPSQSVLNAASAILATATSSIKALTLLRELSDGFQYGREDFGEETCPLCQGSRIATEYYDKNNPDYFPLPDEIEKGEREDGTPLSIATRDIACFECDATGVVASSRRTTHQVPCPKEDALRDIIDQHDDVGRLVIFAGFKGSVDRCSEVVTKLGWQIIRVDGRGWASSVPGKPTELLRAFQMGFKEFPRVCFIGQAGAAGMGLNLTASPSIVYYSNDFNAESRIQSEDRCHRPGMDLNLGCTIYDLFHLPADEYVFKNIQAKRRLQDMSLGQFKEALETMTLGMRYF